MAENINARLETFSDGIFAIAITLLVIEVQVPTLKFVNSTAQLWTALGHNWPFYFSFLLSFITIFISWVNHHLFFRLIDKSSTKFIYANGFFLLSIILMPFATMLLAEFFLTNYLAPAVIIYSFITLLTDLGWIILAKIVLATNTLATNKISEKIIKRILKKSIIAAIIYAVCTILAFWFPLIIISILALIRSYYLYMNIKLNMEVSAF